MNRRDKYKTDIFTRQYRYIILTLKTNNKVIFRSTNGDVIFTIFSIRHYLDYFDLVTLKERKSMFKLSYSKDNDLRNVFLELSKLKFKNEFEKQQNR